MSKTIAKPGPPSVVDCSHYSVALSWGDQCDKLRGAHPNEKPLAEVSIVEESSQDGWKKIYTGFATNYAYANLHERKKYAIRMRFQIKDEWSPYSEPVVVVSLEEPMTGEHIHKAIRNNNINELERVLSNGKINIEAQDGLGFTPLMVATQRNMLDIMKLLLKKKADIEAKTDSGKTSLMLACFKGEWEAINFLIEHGANTNNTDKSRLTAMHYAVDGESTRAIRILCAAGAAVDLTDSILGWSPLMRCAGLKNNGNVDIAKELIKKGANINLQDKEGNTALHLAVINGHYNLFEVVLNAGSDLTIQNKLKNSVIKLVDSSEHTGMKQLVKESMANK